MTKCATGFGLFALATGLVIACGGSAVSDGTANAGGTSGSTATGGASGSITGGAPSGGGPDAGACSLPKQSGNCDAYAPSFWHNPQTGLCEPFVYGGCGGNANRFATREACIATCQGGGNDWGACKGDSDCMLASLGCCEACEPVDENALLALSVGHNGDLQKMQDQQCAGAGACLPCMSVTEYDATKKYFKPACVSGQCSLLDIRQSPLTACKTSSDCVLRDGANCCPGCGSDFVAVSSNANFCSDGPEPCPACASPSPAGLAASCNQGHCALALPTR